MKKTIGIIVAMEKELALLLPLLKNDKQVSANDILFHVGEIEDKKVVVTKCGIGKVNAAVVTLSLIENFHVGLIINSGVAGGTGNGAGILDVVIADRVAYHDVWCGPGTVDGQAAGCPLFFETCVPTEKQNDIKYGLIASGDIFVSRKEDIERIKRLYPEVMAVDMESAAIAHVCFLKHVPFMVIRVVSDTPGNEDNIAQYESFWEDAPKSTFCVLKDIISRI